MPNANYMTNMQIQELQENPGQAIRMPATALLTVDTADQRQTDADNYIVQPYNPNVVYINKQKNLIEGYFTRIALTEINLNWNTPNVIAAQPWANNTLTLQLGANIGPGVPTDSKTISISENFYSPKLLADAVQTALNAGSGTFGSTTWRVLYSDRFNSFQIQNVSGTIPFRVFVNNRGAKDDLCNLMGLSGAPSSFNLVLNGGFAPMCYTPYIDIISNQLTKKQNIRDAGTSAVTGNALLNRVYLNQDGFNIRYDNSTVAPPQVVDTNILGCQPFTYHQEFRSPKQIYWDTKEFINVIDIELRDYKGRVLYSSLEGIPSGVAPLGLGYCYNTTDYQLTFQITET